MNKNKNEEQYALVRRTTLTFNIKNEKTSPFSALL